MTLDSRFRRRLPLATGLVLVLVALAAAFGHGRAATAPLWSDQPVAVTPATVTAPNWEALAQVLKPAVVNVSMKRTAQAPPEAADPFFQQFFGRVPQPRTQRGLGSGFVVNADGYVVTNNHVVDGATEIRVKLADGRELPGRVVGRDPRTDLALLKVEGHGLPTIPLGDSSALKVGEPVMAIGNPFGLEQTVTTGIVSATGRVIGEGPYDDFIQTDASINPGNSGGPLINARGQVIGINTAIVSRSGGSVGIGFAIPVNLAKPVVTQLASAGHVTRGWLGVGIQPLTADLAKSFRLTRTDGALVTSVSEGSPAAKAGLKEGDVIVEYDGRPVARAGDLPRTVAETPVGRAVPLKVVRDGKPVTLTATVGRLEETREAKAEPAPGEPALGVSARTLTPAVAQQLGLREQQGVLIVNVNDGSRADAAGLRAGAFTARVAHPARTPPALRPAASARLPSLTFTMRTPCCSRRPSCWATAGVSVRALTPSAGSPGAGSAFAWRVSSSRPTVAVSVTGLPSRTTLSGTARPTGVSATVRGRSPARATGRPSYSTITSPSLRPAFAAGEPSLTDVTSAPSVRVSRKLLARSAVRGWMPTPSQPRVTWPADASWVTTGLARLTGIAKPMPTDPPLRLTIAVLMPIT